MTMCWAFEQQLCSDNHVQESNNGQAAQGGPAWPHVQDSTHLRNQHYIASLTVHHFLGSEYECKHSPWAKCVDCVCRLFGCNISCAKIHYQDRHTHTPWKSWQTAHTVLTLAPNTRLVANPLVGNKSHQATCWPCAQDDNDSKVKQYTHDPKTSSKWKQNAQVLYANREAYILCTGTPHSEHWPGMALIGTVEWPAITNHKK